MGIFDKKHKRRKNEEFESPTETIDLAGAEEGEEGEEVKEQQEAAVVVAPEPEPAKKSQSYGIEEAIALMRTLPTESVELVVSVVRQTLESTNIDIPLIIADANEKEERIDARIAVLKKAIEELEEEISTRKTEITELEADREETAMVNERLQLAVKLSNKPADAASAKL